MPYLRLSCSACGPSRPRRHYPAAARHGDLVARVCLHRTGRNGQWYGRSSQQVGFRGVAKPAAGGNCHLDPPSPFIADPAVSGPSKPRVSVIFCSLRHQFEIVTSSFELEKHSPLEGLILAHAKTPIIPCEAPRVTCGQTPKEGVVVAIVAIVTVGAIEGISRRERGIESQCGLLFGARNRVCDRGCQAARTSSRCQRTGPPARARCSGETGPPWPGSRTGGSSGLPLSFPWSLAFERAVPKGEKKFGGTPRGAFANLLASGKQLVVAERRYVRARQYHVVGFGSGAPVCHGHVKLRWYVGAE